MTSLTAAEQAFFRRAALHMEDGMGIEDACRAVLADDERLLAATFADDAYLAIQTYDGHKTCSTGPGRQGAFIRSELSRCVYEGINAA